MKKHHIPIPALAKKEGVLFCCVCVCDLFLQVLISVVICGVYEADVVYL